VWWGSCSLQDSWSTLGRSIYYLSYYCYLIYLSSQDSPSSSFYTRVYGVNTSFRYSKILTEVLFVHRPCTRNKADLFYLPVLSMYHRTYVTTEGFVLVLGCVLDPDEVPIADVGHPFVLQNTKDTFRITHGWEDRYSVRSHPTETFLHDCLLWNTFLDSLIFYQREGVSHLTGSCHVPYRLLCQIQILCILEFGCKFIPYNLEVFLS
jgi:hypothetical protein